eukprot:1017014-Amphidinium_carterae.1
MLSLIYTTTELRLTPKAKWERTRTNETTWHTESEIGDPGPEDNTNITLALRCTLSCRVWLRVVSSSRSTA